MERGEAGEGGREGKKRAGEGAGERSREGRGAQERTGEVGKEWGGGARGEKGWSGEGWGLSSRQPRPEAPRPAPPRPCRAPWGGGRDAHPAAPRGQGSGPPALEGERRDRCPRRTDSPGGGQEKLPKGQRPAVRAHRAPSRLSPTSGAALEASWPRSRCRGLPSGSLSASASPTRPRPRPRPRPRETSGPRARPRAPEPWRLRLPGLPPRPVRASSGKDARRTRSPRGAVWERRRLAGCPVNQLPKSVLENCLCPFAHGGPRRHAVAPPE